MRLAGDAYAAAVPAEKNVSSSESSIKENSTYESNASEQTDNQRDNTSAGIAAYAAKRSMLKEISEYKRNQG
jgi:hypothetical protein